MRGSTSAGISKDREARLWKDTMSDPASGASSDQGLDVVEHLLDLARLELEMDVAFIGQFTGGTEVLRWVAGNDDWAGTAVPLEQTYGQRVVQGELAGVVQDARHDERVKDLEATRTANIGAYVGVPILFSDGQVFGTLCCVSHHPEPSLRDRDAKLLHFLATLVAERLEDQERARAVRREAVQRIQACLDAGGPRMVFQPIVELGSRDVVGVEGLARFYEEPLRPPNEWFAEASAVGLGVALELAAVRRCPAEVVEVSACAYASLNVSPATILSGELAGALVGLPISRIVIEVTEHAQIDDYERLHAALSPLRASGLRLAIDDAGAGYASFRHILKLRPDIIKLDVSLTAGIDGDDALCTLASALIAFAARIGATIVAEGVEREEEALILHALGVRYAQGYLFGLPAPLASLGATQPGQ
jgi:EAL domain-containing protein (putative c-di-GMP-specific phosphodiesterase class I)